MADASDSSAAQDLAQLLQTFKERFQGLSGDFESQLKKAGFAPEAEIVAITQADLDGVAYLVTRVPKVPFETLSPQQRRVAVLAMQGFSRKEIATELRIGKRTVDTHFERIHQKCKISSKAALMIRGLLFT